jgi:galactokinase
LATSGFECASASEVVAALRSGFEARFGRAPELGARAPGRVNLIGEHTDYNEGLVLPCAIDRDTFALAARRDDGRFRVWTRDFEEVAGFAVAALERRGGWIDYVQGVVFALLERGIEIGGLDLAIGSRVPLQAGLSSSAALTISVITLINRVFDLELDVLTLARLAHRGESHFVGVGCGIIDPFACSMSRRGRALRIDCRTQVVSEVPVPSEAVRMLFAHSGVRRELAGDQSAYKQRVGECRAALEAARAAGVAPPGATMLRDLGLSDLPSLEAALDPVLLRRARHVLTENARVDSCCAALESGDLRVVGQVLIEGQRSLRDDFEASIPELDTLCSVADAHPGVFGSRLTGAGFGGCTLHLVEPAAADEVRHSLELGFERRFGRRPPILEVVASDGASELEI